MYINCYNRGIGYFDRLYFIPHEKIQKTLDTFVTYSQKLFPWVMLMFSKA